MHKFCILQPWQVLCNLSTPAEEAGTHICTKRAYFAAHLLKARNTRQDEHGGLLEKSCQGCRQLLRAVLDPDTFLIGLAIGISVINIGCSIETNNALQM